MAFLRNWLLLYWLFVESDSSVLDSFFWNLVEYLFCVYRWRKQLNESTRRRASCSWVRRNSRWSWATNEHELSWRKRLTTAPGTCRSTPLPPLYRNSSHSSHVSLNVLVFICKKYIISWHLYLQLLSHLEVLFWSQRQVDLNQDLLTKIRRLEEKKEKTLQALNEQLDNSKSLKRNIEELQKQTQGKDGKLSEANQVCRHFRAFSLGFLYWHAY